MVSSDEEIEKDASNEKSIDIGDSNHFVFHRQDNGNVNADHTFSPYNDEYMRRDTMTYYKDGALESTRSILIKKEAADSMIENYTTVIERQKNAKPGDFIPKPLAPARVNYFKIGLHERFEEDGRILSSFEYNNEGDTVLSKSWQYYDDGSLKKYGEMYGNDTGSITYYEPEEYGGGKKYTDVFENNKSVNRINYD